MEYNALIDLMEKIRDLGLLQGPIRRSGEHFIGISCLFAAWKHGDGTDRKPSMAVSFGKGKSILKCHTCQYKRPLVNALVDLNALSQGRIQNLVSIATEAEEKIPDLPSLRRGKEPEVKDYTKELEQLLKNPMPKEALDFLESKGVDQTWAKKLKFCWADSIHCERSDGTVYTMERMIIFPVLSIQGGKTTCVGAQARSLDVKPTESKYVAAFRFPSGLFFFGEHLLSKVGGKRIILVEGPMDHAHLLSVGEWAFGLVGLYLSPEKMEKIKRAAPRMVYIVLDPDQNNKPTTSVISRTLNAAGIPNKVIPVEKDPRRLTREDLNRYFI